ncbi:MAG: 50S ribosomal protein L25 [Anaerolineales bacterium]|nr:MAG: 50S ribosomal protein L25 [Anaerolineales bacterium]
MEEVVLEAKNRRIVGKQVRALRREGVLPATLYGRHVEPISISLDYREVSKIMPYITSSQLIVLDLEGEKHHALVREKQIHPVRNTLQHVDFLVVSMTEKIRASVTIDLHGDAPAVGEYGAILVTGQEYLEVECLPGDLTDRILIDVSSIKEIGDALYVRDIQLSDTITILTDPDEMVVLATYAEIEAEEEEEVEEEELEVEPELVERGKREEVEEENE